MKRSGNQQTVIGRRRLAARGLAVAAVTGLAVCSLPATGWGATSTGGTIRPAAVYPAGSLFAWGDNEGGQLGNGDMSSNPALSPVAVKLPAGTEVTQAQGSCENAYALTAQGQVWAWGDNSAGQLGDGGQEHSSSVPVRVSLPAGVTVTSVQAGCQHAVALTSTGEVLAWGINADRELGDGGIESSSNIPVRVHMPTGIRVTAVSAGDNFSLALTAAGQVFAWGDNSSGRLGAGTTGAFSPTPVPVKLPALTRVTAISAGTEHSLARTVSGGVLAWGANSLGELGDGGAEDHSNVPVRVSLPRGTRVTSVSAGFSNSMALTNFRQVLVWGTNQHGELGTGTATGFGLLPTPVKLPAGSLVTAITAGHRHDVALTATGRVYGWGTGSLLGTGSSSEMPSLPVQAHLPAGLAVGIGAGPVADISLAIVLHTGR
jgi:alpha-tubulin suppressor-like RCC1 family protein